VTDAIFRHKEWGIFRATKENAQGGFKLYGIHMTCKSDVGQKYSGVQDIGSDVSWLNGEDPVCWNCHHKVPDPIQGLISLYEWDNND